jgi:dephospho-CoA kinase
MKRIIITGGIASGKSTISEYLNNKGFIIIDADKIGKEIFKENYSVLCKLFNHTEEGFRTFLIDNVFKDKEMLTQLEKFMHPKISIEMDRLHELYNSQNIPHIIDNAIHFEKFEQKENDYVILVSISHETQFN